MAGRINEIWLSGLVCLPILAGLVAPAHAAPILGQNQEEQIAQPTPTPLIRPTELGAHATVIHFSILPSPANPDRFETTIFVQQDGGRQICVNHTSPAIVVRSYQTDADPFAPDLPSRIEGQESGDVGELAGFNSKNVFIRPRETDDRFDLPDEPFSVGQFDGVFRPDEFECDQLLTEGDFVCVDQVIRTDDCDLTQHASLVRDLRIMLALNSIPVNAPAAGGSLFGQTGQGSDTGVIDQPSRFTGAAPHFSGSFGGSGGDGLILVPDMIGLKLSTAKSLITSTGFNLGDVTENSSSNANLLQGLIISIAHAQSDPAGETDGGIVTGQEPEGGTRAPSGTAVNLTVKISSGDGGATAVPEPSSSSIFIVGLLLITGIYWFSRRRSRRRWTPA